MTLFTASWGTGRGAFAIHGLGASSLYWDGVAQHLPGLVAVDLLGFGRSPCPDDATYDLDCHLDALEPALPDRSVVVVAHSTGCLVALALAARHPDRVRALVLTGLPAWPDEGTARVEVGRIGAMARWTARGNRAARTACRLVCDHRHLAAALAPLIVRSVPPSVAVDGTRHCWASYKRTMDEVVVARPAAALLAGVHQPVTVLHGRSDRTTRLSWVSALEPRPNVEVRVLDVDHHPALRAPRTVAAAIAARDGSDPVR